MTRQPSSDNSRPMVDRELEAFCAEGKRYFEDVVRGFEEASNTTNHSSHRDNPFLSFKQYVDQSFASLAENLARLPTNITELRTEMQRDQDRAREEEADISRRWTGSTDSPDQLFLELQRSTVEEKEDAQSVARSLIDEASRRNKDVPMWKIKALFEDKESFPGQLDQFASPMLSFGGACYYKPESGDNLPSTSSYTLRWPESTIPWLSINWFKRSPYSPIRLEAHPDTAQSGARWRAAFEDLLCAALDKPMTSTEKFGIREPYGNPQSTYNGPGLDWMLSLQCRGILPPLFQRTFNSREYQQLSRPSELLRLLEHSRSKTPWFTEDAITRCNAAEQDFAELVAEIATKATSQGLESGDDQHSNGLTELDVYETLHHALTDERKHKQMLDGNDWHSLWKAASSNQRHIKSSTQPTTSTTAMSRTEENTKRESLDAFEAVTGHLSDKSSSTEFLEVLERSLRTSSNEGQAAESAAALRDKAQSAASKKGDLLSALTTTETTRSPDGVITTKVVLKRRFSNGHEETSETVHAYREEVGREEVSDLQTKKKMGWFWS